MPIPLHQIRTLSRSSRTPWLILVLLVCATVGWSLCRSASLDVARTQAALSRTTEIANKRVHYVTPRQLLASNAMMDRKLSALSALGDDGERRDWPELSAGQPVVFVFVKEGCPCNVDFEPFFHRVERLYRGSVRFAAVIDGDVAAARAYAEELNVPYPVLADPEHALIRKFGAENGGYVALLAGDGTIEGFWPGCSADGLRDLGRRIARLGEIEERPLDVSGMTRPLITGCPFEL
ncbi:Peroxiredoxin [Singulisphaera sp. GP187]|uniref:peroxiredoxin family protein n=1 Tax=Singulisphaera sp. GP187 TaxID=1882752 RepID=UPI0009283C9B|nr:redoxin domain-containing protein [Singulisphaera sp. GP187]SIO35273.1 Peroxiredoxin [Singulisphaera sp. GP187]